MRIFNNINLNHVLRIFKQKFAIRAEMQEVQTFSGLFILDRQSVNRFQCRVVSNTRMLEINYDIVHVCIVAGVEKLFKLRNGTKKQRTMQLVNFLSAL